MLYLPPDNENLASLIVEIQRKIDKDFIARLIRYSLNVYDTTGSYPHIIVISMAGFSSKHYRDSKLNKEETEPYYTHPCQSWALSTRFYTPDSIAIDMDKNPLDKMIALCHVFFMQEKNILMLKKYNDSSIQAIYKIPFDVCSVDTDKIGKLFADARSFCDVIESQIGKILNERDRKRQVEYAEDTVQLARQFKHRCLPEEGAVSPPESEDLVFVKNKRRTNVGRFSWSNCYSEGRLEGHFRRYGSHGTLRKAFENNTL